MPTLSLTRTIPLDDSYDVIVAGGGPSGSTAATASARAGKKTLLIEATGMLGGMGTAGLVPAWCPFTDGEKIIYRGLAERVLRESRQALPHVTAIADWVDWFPIDAESLKRTYDRMVTESGASVLFQSMIAGVETDGKTITAVVVANKSGLTAYRARVYVDATGDGDLSAWAGASFEKGDANGALQPATHCFTLGNVDTYAFQYTKRLDWRFGKEGLPLMEYICRTGAYPEISDSHDCPHLVGPTIAGFNTGHLWDIDNTDPESVSRALVQGRRMAKAYRDALAEHLPAVYGNAHLVATAPLLGIRETRRIIGDYVLSVDDYLNRRSFPDEIGRNCYYIDIHHAKDDKDWKEDPNKTLRYKKGESHGIPYRCLTPKDLTNVLVAGRSISCDRTVQGSVRVMPPCLVTGEAAGIAAAMAAALPGHDVHAVDTARLRAAIAGHGGYLPG
jgi:hypothetical protein